MHWMIAIVLGFFIVAGQPPSMAAQDFKKWQAEIAGHKRWLDSMGPQGKRFWLTLDGGRRPHRLYLGEEFFRADAKSQRHFVEIFSIYLAGHPEKSMLIDLFDASTKKPVGEYGWGGFKLNGGAH